MRSQRLIAILLAMGRRVCNTSVCHTPSLCLSQKERNEDSVSSFDRLALVKSRPDSVRTVNRSRYLHWFVLAPNLTDQICCLAVLLRAKVGECTIGVATRAIMCSAAGLRHLSSTPPPILATPIRPKMEQLHTDWLQRLKRLMCDGEVRRFH
jgi:hypothetical protein